MSRRLVLFASAVLLLVSCDEPAPCADCTNADAGSDAAADAGGDAATDGGGVCTAATFYVDADHDGFGAIGGATSCGPAPSFVAVSGDCDDTRADVHPGATEDCGPVDLNCDGDPTKGAMLQNFYIDLDGDGYASSDALAFPACVAPGPNFTTILGDCAPLDPKISPAATEIYYNGIDDDCNPATVDDDRDGDGLPVAIDCNDDDPLVRGPGNSFVDVAPTAGLAGSILKFNASGQVCSQHVFVGGAAIGDIDGDALWDVYIAGLDGTGYLHRNLGNGTFANVTTAAGLLPTSGGSAGVFADFDADGDSDLFVTSASTGTNQLYMNDGTGKFSEEGLARGVSLPLLGKCGARLSVTAADIDGDGDIDLHVPSWDDSTPILALNGLVLLNDGTAHFLPAPLTRGLVFPTTAAFTPSYADFDGDGRRDLALTGDFHTSRFLRALGDGMFRTFIDVTTMVGAGLDENGMGASVADYDGDGDLDWFVGAIHRTSMGCYPESPGCSGNRLYRNRGDGTFDEVARTAGVADGGWAWGAAFFDFDNDGDLDLGNTNGFPVYGHDDDRIRLFVADGAGAFTDQACTLGMAATGEGRAFVPFDFDGDGDLDVLTTENGTSPLLYRNDVGNALPWLRVRLRDATSKNTEALGATVWMQRRTGSPWVRREIHANSTYAGVAPAEAHFGLGVGEDPIAQLRIVWPDGAQQIVTGVAVRQAIRIDRTASSSRANMSLPSLMSLQP